MSDGIVQTTVEILGKAYAIKCTEKTEASLQKAAAYLDTKMKEVRESGKAINLERIAVITALNIADQFLELNAQKETIVGKINNRIHQLHEKIDTAMNKPIKPQLLYTVNER